ncbi:MAG: hypothetical protein WCC90_05040 [Methylocella sp.]
MKTYADFQTLPLTTKQNYMLAYPLPALTRDGRLAECEMVAVSSGSTGRPLFWPRSSMHELDIATRFEHVFHGSFHADTLPTLVVIVEALGAHFDQVVLAGYPPFLKEVVDSGIAQGVDWRRYRVKLILAGEVFSEEWRGLVGERLGADDICYQSSSLYGTADGGVLGNETPVSIAIRRFFAAHPEATRAAFGVSRLPTLVQYGPLSRFFETDQGTLVVSGDSGVPLIRYHIADQGGIYNYDVPAQHQMPQVTLAPAGDSEYFPVGVKHRYTRK